MAQQNSTLDDIAAVIGFSATIRLVAWFGDQGNLYVPTTPEPENLLTKLVGASAARRLAEEWPGVHLAVPGLARFDLEVKRRLICRCINSGLSTGDAALLVKMGERRVQQICRELERDGLLEPVAPKVARKKARQK